MRRGLPSSNKVSFTACDLAWIFSMEKGVLMLSRTKKFIRMCALLGVGAFALLFAAEEASALVKKMSVRGYLSYRGRRGKSFYWRLRLYPNTGIIIGSGRDKDGYAEFFGTYSRFTKRFYMVKHFKYRRGSNNKFYYKGKLRGRRLYGSAHRGSYWGRRYASWSARINYSRYRFTRGRAKRFSLRGKLRYYSGGRKNFYWRLSYYPSSGRCFGNVRDKDGRATFSGVYDRKTKRIFLRKKYSSSRVFYYSGYMTKTGFYGVARKFSFTSRKKYASWTAKRRWQWRGGGGDEGGGAAPPPPPRRRMKKFYLRGTLRYFRGSRKSFSWTLRYYPSSGLCFGEVRDKDGYAKFSGTCNPRTGQLKLRKRFIGRRGRNNTFYYTGRITRKGARGLARKYSYRGRAYASWKARVVWRAR